MLKGEHSSAVWLVGMVFACIAIAILLTAPIVRRVFRPLIEPKPRWLFIRTDDDKPERPSRTDPTGSRRS